MPVGATELVTGPVIEGSTVGRVTDEETRVNDGAIVDVPLGNLMVLDSLQLVVGFGPPFPVFVVGLGTIFVGRERVGKPVPVGRPVGPVPVGRIVGLVPVGRIVMRVPVPEGRVFTPPRVKENDESSKESARGKAWGRGARSKMWGSAADNVASAATERVLSWRYILVVMRERELESDEVLF